MMTIELAAQVYAHIRTARELLFAHRESALGDKHWRRALESLSDAELELERGQWALATAERRSAARDEPNDPAGTGPRGAD